jgi:hypothetical protein
MKAPEKIYLQVCGDCNANDCENCKFEDLEDNVTWCKDKIFDKDIEYTRTDAFIEKACEWLNKHAKKYYFNKEKYLGTEELVEDFKLSMEM